MGYSFLDAIYNEYASNNMDDIYAHATESELTFRHKYITPLIKENKKEGEEMEVFFNAALFQSNEEDFKNGFKACMRLINECLNPR